ncbi:MAG: hypothetical protein EBS35_05625 [Bacteroidetes bacterium]|nr:hypothetical protein [Bacteroidota bacterium]
MPEIQYLGIRHHGPGSARRMLRFLENWKPDCILIEAPSESTHLFSSVNNPNLVPPVAMLLYEPLHLKNSLILPFAHFSPEWIAISFANKAGVPLIPFDLPASMMLPLSKEIESVRDVYVKDPLSQVAQHAGYSDSERWWEHTFEQVVEDEEVFRGLSELMVEVREQLQRSESKETLLREAWMRQIIRTEVTKNYQRIAIVCGAWHIPALLNWHKMAAKQDKLLLKDLLKVKIAGTWIPWSYDRLARQSGYGAGILAPAWYEILFDQQREAPTTWLVQMAKLFRKEGIDISPAHLQAILSLSVHLSFLKDKPDAGLDELLIAIEAVLHLPKEVLLSKIQSKWIIGEKVGQVPVDIPQTPLQTDLLQQIKSARLKNEFQSTQSIRKQLDLRVNANRMASLLLHQLNILEIPWGIQEAVSDQVKGSFHENWRLKWKPVYMIELIDKGAWGNTIAEAAENKMKIIIDNAQDTISLVNYLEKCILAGLEILVDQLSVKMRSMAVDAPDISQFLQSLPILVRILRYPSHRVVSPDKIYQWLNTLIPYICSGLPSAAYQISDEPAQILEQQISDAHAAIYLIDGNEFIEQWENALHITFQLEGVNMRINGLVMRILMERDKLDLDFILARMTLILSKGNEPLQVAFWLEGFFKRGVYLLQYQEEMFDSLDLWISQIKEDHFPEVLPLLRRTFSLFNAGAKQEIWEKVTQSNKELPKTEIPLNLNDPQIKEFLPLFQKILA